MLQSIGLVVESNKKVSGEMEKNVAEITNSYNQQLKILSHHEKAVSTSIKVLLILLLR